MVIMCMSDVFTMYHFILQYGKTALQLASDRDHSDVIEALVEAGADLSKLGKVSSSS